MDKGQFKRDALRLGGFSVLSTGAVALAAYLGWRLEAGVKSVLLFANANLVVQCRDLAEWMSAEPVILVNDGVAMDAAAKLVHGRKFTENLNGTDFTPYLLGKLGAPQRLFLLGGRPGVAEQAGRVIAERFGHEIVGCSDGFEGLRDALLLDRINASGAQIILVALGNPRQEQWIHLHHKELSAPLILGIGALFDFMSGNIKRAPLWVQRMRCEWLFRLSREPRRLLKRYTVDTLLFFWLVFRGR